MKFTGKYMSLRPVAAETLTKREVSKEWQREYSR